MGCLIKSSAGKIVQKHSLGWRKMKSFSFRDCYFITNTRQSHGNLKNITHIHVINSHCPSLLTQFIHSAISMCFYPLQSLVRTAIGALEIPESGLFWLQALESWIIFQTDTETAFTRSRKRDIISILHYTTRAPANSSEIAIQITQNQDFYMIL